MCAVTHVDSKIIGWIGFIIQGAGYFDVPARINREFTAVTSRQTVTDCTRFGIGPSDINDGGADAGCFSKTVRSILRCYRGHLVNVTDVYWDRFFSNLITRSGNDGDTIVVFIFIVKDLSDLDVPIIIDSELTGVLST